MSAVVLAMLSAISGGFANLFARRLVSVSQARHMLSLNFALMAVMLLPAAPWFFQLHITGKSLLILVGAIGLDGLANYGYFRSFERLDAVSVSGMLAVSPLFALILSPVFLYQGEFLGWKQIAAVLFFTGGVLMILLGFRQDITSQSKLPFSEVVFPLGTAFFFSLSMFLVKDLFSGNYLNPYTYYLIRATVISAVSWVITKPNLSWVNRSSLVLTVGRLVFVIGQWLFLLSALRSGHPAFVKAISDLSPIIVVLFSWSFLREKPSLMQVLGMAIILVGGCILAF
jgi:drug/metabolite transporter (DMT)-like permease